MWGRAEQAASSLQKATRGSFVLSEQGQRGRKSETSEQQAGNLGAVRPPPAVRGPRRVSRQPSATPPEGRFSCSQPACASRGAHCVPHLSPPGTGRMCLALRGPGRPPRILRAAPQEVWLKAGPRPTPDVFYAEKAVERSIRPAPRPQPPRCARTRSGHPALPRNAGLGLPSRPPHQPGSPLLEVSWIQIPGCPGRRRCRGGVSLWTR